MVNVPADAPEDTASSADVLLNLSAFVPHLRSMNRSTNTIRGYVEAVEKLDAFLAANGMPRTPQGQHTTTQHRCPALSEIVRDVSRTSCPSG